MNNQAKIFYTLDKLEEVYHNEARSPELGHSEPLDGLILTIISQNTNDKNRDAAFANLKANFPNWPDVVNAGNKKLEDVIRTAGLAHTKAERIIHILQKIHDDFHEYSIKRLAERTRDEMKSYLRALPGVGAKTVACVLLFDFKIAAFPVDTHVARVSKRVGIAPENFSPEEISSMLEEIVPAERCLGGHVNIIAHGRAVCHSRKPECKICVLNEVCNYKNFQEV
ncbi:MAG: endonuclease III [Synergistaceae bacterium]|nr:endonuclease III [Synergistaceae bacterium]